MGIPKFNYLSVQLQDEVARVAIWFLFTDMSYEQSVILLRERFNQSYKPINAHMQVLLNLINVNTTQ